MSINLKYFTVTNTTTGQMPISGRSTNYTTILSQNDVITKLSTGVDVPGAPYSITSGPMSNIGNIASTYIQIVKDFITKVSSNVLFIPENIIRVTFLGGTTSSADSLIYGFAPSLNTPINDITFNVIIANSNSQTLGDYFDIPFPDTTFYPNLFIVFVILNGAWDTRTIVSGNICSMNTSSSLNYCINPAYSNSDVNQSHFICVNGINAEVGAPSNISFGIETQPLSVSKDYSNLKFSISSAYLNDVYTNDTYVQTPICYCKGTKILCLGDDCEIYVNIEDLKEGDYVKTFTGNYKPILMITKGFVINDPYGNKFKRIYRIKNDEDEYLYVTSFHAILADELSDEEYETTRKIFGRIEKIHNKYRLIACTSKKFEPVIDENRYEIYHLSLGEHELIYANNILSEAFDYEWYFKSYIKKDENN